VESNQARVKPKSDADIIELPKLIWSGTIRSEELLMFERSLQGKILGPI